MTKGIFGLKLSAIAILIFVICFFGSIEVLLLLGAYALLLEKNRWLTKQAFQALYLKLGYIIALSVVGWVFDFFRFLFGWSAFLGSVQTILNFLIGVVLLLLTLLAILRVMKEEDADLPLFGNLADYTMDVVKEKVSPVVPKTTPTVQPAPPVVPVAPPPPPKPPVPIERASPDSWTCECGRSNSGRFCMGCGKPQPSEPPVEKTPEFAAEADQEHVASGINETIEPAAEESNSDDSFMEAGNDEESVEAAAPDDELSEEVLSEADEEADEEAEREPEQVIADPDNWVCGDCGRENFGKFCMGCGKPHS